MPLAIFLAFHWHPSFLSTSSFPSFYHCNLLAKSSISSGLPWLPICIGLVGVFFSWLRFFCMSTWKFIRLVHLV